MATHWSYTQRAMAEGLTRDPTPRDIWDQHEAILSAVIASDRRRAEVLARQHIMQAASFMVRRLREEAASSELPAA